MNDVYFKKRLDYYCRGQSFAFDVAHTLFSSHQIDEGTDLFLRTIDVPAPRSIIDMGCGCGVIGIVLARMFPDGAGDLRLIAICWRCAIPGIMRRSIRHAKSHGDWQRRAWRARRMSQST